MELMESQVQRQLAMARGPIRLGVACACSVIGLSCLNPFAPKLTTEFKAQTCSDLTIIENVLCTFRNAYTFKDTALYSSIIDKDFAFTYRDYDHGVDVSWGRSDEMRTTYGLFQSVEELTLIWNNEVSSSSNDTSYSSVRGFDLTVTFNPSDIVRVSGYANLTFVLLKNTGTWKIVRWRDESNF